MVDFPHARDFCAETGVSCVGFLLAGAGGVAFLRAGGCGGGGGFLGACGAAVAGAGEEVFHVFVFEAQAACIGGAGGFVHGGFQF